LIVKQIFYIFQEKKERKERMGSVPPDTGQFDLCCKATAILYNLFQRYIPACPHFYIPSN